MSDEPDGLEPDILSVLRAAKPVAEVPTAARARILGAVTARIAALPSGGGGGDGGQGKGGAPPGAEPGNGLRGLRGLVASRPLLALAVAVAVGGAAGALGRGAPEQRVVYVDRPAPVTASTTPPPVPTATQAGIDVDALPELAASTHPSAAPLDPGAALAAESALLDVARTALSRGEPDHALAAVARHAAQFPHGVLGEEREALAVKALVRSGRGGDARARAERFRARYPQSMFSTAIDSSLKSVPEMDSPPPTQP